MVSAGLLSLWIDHRVIPCPPLAQGGISTVPRAGVTLPLRTHAVWKQNRLENIRKRGILEDTKYVAIPITDEAIQSVPRLRPQGWSVERAARLQEAHRELLRAVQSKPVGTEAGRIYHPDMSPISQLVTGEASCHQVTLPSCEVPHIVIHSHPDGQIFSGTDIYASSFLLVVWK